MSEHVYCVAIVFKMAEQVEQQICVKFWMKVEYSSTETIQMIQKVTAIGNRWLAASSQQSTQSCFMSGEEFFGETLNHPGDSAPLQPRFRALWLLAYPTTKITFERAEIPACQWDSGKYGAADDNWETCVRSQGAFICIF